MSLCGDFEDDRISNRAMPLPSVEDEARVDFVMANMVRNGIYFTYEGPGKADLTDNQLLILGARLEKLRQEEHAAALTRPVDAEELARRLKARSPSPVPSWTSEDERHLTEIAREKLERYGYPMPSSEDLEHPSEQMIMMARFFEIRDEISGRGGSMLRYLEADWWFFLDRQPIDRRISDEVIASGAPSRGRRRTLEKAAAEYRDFRKEYGYSEVEFKLSSDIASQSRLTNWCEYQFRHMNQQACLKADLERHDQKIAEAKAGQGVWPWQAHAISRDATLAVFDSHIAVLDWIEERRQEMAGEKPRHAAPENGTEVSRALSGAAAVSADSCTMAAAASRPRVENPDDFAAMMTAMGYFGTTDDSVTQKNLTPAGIVDGFWAWAKSKGHAPPLPTSRVNTTKAPRKPWRGCGNRGCHKKFCSSPPRDRHEKRVRVKKFQDRGQSGQDFMLRRSTRVARQERELTRGLSATSRIQKPAQRRQSDRKVKRVRDDIPIGIAGSVEIAESIEISEPIETLKFVKKSLESTRMPTEGARASRTTSKSASKSHSKKAEVKAMLPGKIRASTVARGQGRKIAGRVGPKIETTNVVTATRKGRTMKKPVRYGLDKCDS